MMRVLLGGSFRRVCSEPKPQLERFFSGLAGRFFLSCLKKWLPQENQRGKERIPSFGPISAKVLSLSERKKLQEEAFAKELKKIARTSSQVFPSGKMDKKPFS